MPADQRSPAPPWVRRHSYVMPSADPSTGSCWPRASGRDATVFAIIGVLLAVAALVAAVVGLG